MKFSGVTILQGVEFSIFPIDFEWALQQCSATALPVMVVTRICMIQSDISPVQYTYFLCLPSSGYVIMKDTAVQFVIVSSLACIDVELERNIVFML